MRREKGGRTRGETLRKDLGDKREFRGCRLGGNTIFMQRIDLMGKRRMGGDYWESGGLRKKGLRKEKKEMLTVSRKGRVKVGELR